MRARRQMGSCAPRAPSANCPARTPTLTGAAPGGSSSRTACQRRGSYATAAASGCTRSCRCVVVSNGAASRHAWNDKRSAPRSAAVNTKDKPLPPHIPFLLPVEPQDRWTGASHGDARRTGTGVMGRGGDRGSGLLPPPRDRGPSPASLADPTDAELFEMAGAESSPWTPCDPNSPDGTGGVPRRSAGRSAVPRFRTRAGGRPPSRSRGHARPDHGL